ncbi:flavin-containing monooxygenase FMO GS-OX-like 2 [Varanus komodoensis]|uniref:flavin-containing monooxygenase FMO GS-OX-like 2 n=1 Tax=Varanus komodoensis TaxID=61221 RepID=UPI001CF79A90|nr:flavin-containing monooxygenase FMO GS-OX-like 2 [Varanus komodoensis]XP_044277008.1 flavin-containing monooxygenase FMO GS-OX-like 2 [Varanus komodoensis]
MASTKLRVAVIGAGAAGLCAARHLLASPDTFAPPVVFEGSSRLGGTWVYTEETGEDAWGWTIHSSMYHDLRTNLPKEVMAFPDFPFDPSLPSFLHHSDVLSYLESYAEHFGIQDNIRFHWQVEEVRPGQKGQTGSPCGWDVTAVLRAPDSAQRVTEHFDAVLVCTGHYASPFLPAIPGLDSFQGHLLHSHSYRHPEPFAGQSVVLVGAGSSGVDLALELLPLAARVMLSHHGPPVSGLPEDVQQVPLLSQVAQKAVVCSDGSVLQADTLILCTGYRYHFPFLDLAQLGLQETDYGVGPLYLHLLPPQHPSLLFLGLCQRICPFPHFHCQARFAVAVLAGRCPLPSAAAMEADAQAQLEQHLRSGGLARHFLWLKDQQWSYADELAQKAGFPPLPPAVRGIYEAVCASRARDLATYRSQNYKLLGASAWELV